MDGLSGTFLHTFLGRGASAKQRQEEEGKEGKTRLSIPLRFLREIKNGSGQLRYVFLRDSKQLSLFGNFINGFFEQPGVIDPVTFYVMSIYYGGRVHFLQLGRSINWLKENSRRHTE